MSRCLALEVLYEVTINSIGNVTDVEKLKRHQNKVDKESIRSSRSCAFESEVLMTCLRVVTFQKHCLRF